jgi:hypothetical protein
MSKLRAVNPDERARKKMSVVEAADHGTHQDLLRALRARVAAATESPNAHPRDLAALSRQLITIAKELEALDVTVEDDVVGVAARTPEEPWDSSAV